MLQLQKVDRNRQANLDMYAHTSKENNAVRSHEASERAKDRSLDRQLGNMSNDMQMQMAFIEKRHCQQAYGVRP